MLKLEGFLKFRVLGNCLVNLVLKLELAKFDMTHLPGTNMIRINESGSLNLMRLFNRLDPSQHELFFSMLS